MLKLTITGNFDVNRVQQLKDEEMNKYKRALKSYEDIFYLFEKPSMKKRMIKGKIDLMAVEKILQRFKDGYDFNFEITPSQVVLTWNRHWTLDYPAEDEAVTGLFYHFIQQYTSLGYNIGLVLDKLNSLRDGSMFLPKKDRPTVRSKVIESSKAEWLKKLKQYDENCVIMVE